MEKSRSARQNIATAEKSHTHNPAKVASNRSGEGLGKSDFYAPPSFLPLPITHLTHCGGWLVVCLSILLVLLFFPEALRKTAKITVTPKA